MQSFKDIVAVLMRQEEFDQHRSKEASWGRKTTAILGILFWATGFVFALFDAKGISLLFYFLGIGFGGWSLIGESSQIIRSLKNPLKDNLPTLYAYEEIRADIHSALLAYEAVSLIYVKQIFDERHCSMQKNLRWMVGPLESVGLLSIIGTLAVGIFQFYSSSGSLWVSFVVAGLVFGFLLGILQARNVMNWLGWSADALARAIDSKQRGVEEHQEPKTF